MGGQRDTQANLPTGKTRYPLCRMVGGPQGWSGRVRNVSPPPGFDLRTVQPAVSRYTDWTIPAHIHTHTHIPVQPCLYACMNAWLYKVQKNCIPRLREVTAGTCSSSTRDRQFGSDWGWKSSKTAELFWKKVVFRTNLEQMFKRSAADCDILPTATQQRLTCAIKQCQVAAVSTVEP